MPSIHATTSYIEAPSWKIGGTYTETQEMLKLLLSQKMYLGIIADYLQYATDIQAKKRKT